jgi:hypothetical protein
MYFSSTALTPSLVLIHMRMKVPKEFFFSVPFLQGRSLLVSSSVECTYSPCHLRTYLYLLVTYVAPSHVLSLSLSHWSLVQELLQRQWAAVSFVYLRIHGRQLEWDLSATSCSSEEIEIFAASAATAATVEILHRSDQVAADCRAVWRAGRVDCRIVYVRGTYYCFEQQEFCDAFFLRFFFFFF